MARPRALLYFSSLFLVAAVAVVAVNLPSLLQKEQFLKDNRSVGVAVDWGDVALQSEPKHFFQKAASLGVKYGVLDVEDKPDIENFIRSQGAHILWRADPLTPDRYADFRHRLKEGDGVLPNEQGAFGYPGYLGLVRSDLAKNQAFICWVEFDTNKGTDVLAREPNRVVKTHVLHLEEVVHPAADVWRARFLRAVRERAVRLLVVRLSPLWSSDQQMIFLESVVTDLNVNRFNVGRPSLAPVPWPNRAGAFRPFAIFFAALGPLAGLILAQRFFAEKPWPAFLTVTFVSLVSGIAAHVLAFDPRALVGLVEFRGVKVALIFPLLGSIPLFYSRDAWQKVWEEPIRFKHVFWGLALVIVFVGGLLIRSGNFPALAVSGAERRIRDFLETIFTVRPRFKEFLIGAPLLLHGFRRGLKTPLLIILGLVGPASIVNTFCHLHEPLSLGLIRTFHGVWLGGLVYGLTLIPIRAGWISE